MKANHRPKPDSSKSRYEKPFFVAAGFAVALSLGFTSCGVTDVVAKVANASFKAVTDASGNRVAWSQENEAWSISSPAGDEVLFSADFARSGGIGGSADMEFNCDAAPFIAAGVDPLKIEGWAFAKVETKDDAGKTVFVDKLLKPLDLK
jgi:hypothetical protein